MGRTKYTLEKGTQIGQLYRDFYTERKTGQKKIRLKGYIFLGIFAERGVGLEIAAYRTPQKMWQDKEIWRIRSGRKSIGYFVKEEREAGGKRFHYLKGKIDIGGLMIKVNAYPEKDRDGKDRYTIEIMEPIECGIVRLV